MVSQEFIISTSVAIIAIFIAIYFGLKSIKKKEISYKINKDSLIDIKTEVKPKLKIFYENTSIENLFLFKITFENTGNQDIEKEDFSEPFELEFNKDANIVSQEVTEWLPNTNKIELQLTQNSVIISPRLIKVHDLFTIKFLISNYKNYAINDRLKNTKVKEFTRNKKTYYSVTLATIMLIIFAIIVSITEIINPQLIQTNFLILMIPIFLFMLLIVTPIIWDKDYRERMFGTSSTRKVTKT